MGGTISVESELGKGSVFSFTARLQRGEIKDESRIRRITDWDKIRILVVDDDRYIVDDFKGIINKFGAPCDTAESGKQALELFDQNGDYNLIFIDWKMPGMDGIELATEIKKRTTDKNDVVLVMMSAGDGSAIAAEAKEAGIRKFFQKPLFPSTIADIVSEYFNVGGEQNEGVAEADNNISFAGHRILLAEDVEINREIVLALLEPKQLEVDCAVNGAQAVEMFSASPERYDLIFMDVQMPEMDGLTATANIRAMGTEKAKNIPIIAMTANVFQGDVEKCLAAGMNDHLGKPINFDDVLAKLRTYLS